MFRILITPAIYDTCDTAIEAQGLAMREARQLLHDCSQRVECRVYRMGQPETDVFGRDMTPAFLIGRAVGDGHSVTWVEAAPLRIARAVA
jgi:hypothetical protein